MKNVPIVVLPSDAATSITSACRDACAVAVNYAQAVLARVAQATPSNEFPHIANVAHASQVYCASTRANSARHAIGCGPVKVTRVRDGLLLVDNGPMEGSRFSTDNQTRVKPMSADYVNQVQKVLVCEMLHLTGSNRGKISGYQVYFCTPNPDEATGFTWESLAESETWFPVQEPAAQPKAKMFNPFTTGAKLKVFNFGHK
jgi:hypothetical protein